MKPVQCVGPVLTLCLSCTSESTGTHVRFSSEFFPVQPLECLLRCDNGEVTTATVPSTKVLWVVPLHRSNDAQRQPIAMHLSCSHVQAHGLARLVHTLAAQHSFEPVAVGDAHATASTTATVACPSGGASWLAELLPLTVQVSVEQVSITGAFIGLAGVSGQCAAVPLAAKSSMAFSDSHIQWHDIVVGVTVLMKRVGELELTTVLKLERTSMRAGLTELLSTRALSLRFEHAMSLPAAAPSQSLQPQFASQRSLRSMMPKAGPTLAVHGDIAACSLRVADEVFGIVVWLLDAIGRDSSPRVVSPRRRAAVDAADADGAVVSAPATSASSLIIKFYVSLSDLKVLLLDRAGQQRIVASARSVTIRPTANNLVGATPTAHMPMSRHRQQHRLWVKGVTMTLTPPVQPVRDASARGPSVGSSPSPRRSSDTAAILQFLTVQTINIDVIPKLTSTGLLSSANQITASGALFTIIPIIDIRAEGVVVVWSPMLFACIGVLSADTMLRVVPLLRAINVARERKRSVLDAVGGGDAGTAAGTLGATRPSGAGDDPAAVRFHESRSVPDFCAAHVRRGGGSRPPNPVPARTFAAVFGDWDADPRASSFASSGRASDAAVGMSRGFGGSLVDVKVCGCCWRCCGTVLRATCHVPRVTDRHVVCCCDCTSYRCCLRVTVVRADVCKIPVRVWCAAATVVRVVSIIARHGWCRLRVRGASDVVGLQCRAGNRAVGSSHQRAGALPPSQLPRYPHCRAAAHVVCARR